MRKLILIVALTFGILNISTAQGAVTMRSNGAGDIERETKVLKCEELTEIVSLLPTVVRIVEGEEGLVEIVYPKAEADYLKFIVKGGNILTLGRDTDKKMLKNTLVTEHNPIEVRVSASTINYILNRSDMSLYIERDAFADVLTIGNSGGLFIHADTISADVINIVSQGTTTCLVKEWRANSLMLTNTGALYVKGVTNARKIEHHSAGIDNVELDVACSTLEMLSNGSGIIEYRGTADEVTISSMGSATIRTSELNRE